VTSSESWARFYDFDPTVPEDLAFYRALVTPRSRVLELGCGTGRVLVPLAPSCATLWGLDSSPAMLELCREKLRSTGRSGRRTRLILGDMASFDLGATFDLVIAPYRSFQSLLEDEQVKGCLSCIKRHLAPGGSAVLDVFHPEPELLESWSQVTEEPCWEVEEGNLEVTCHVRGLGLDRRRQIQRVRLTFRQYLEGELEELASLELAMRYYLPSQLEALLDEAGLEIAERWGGYRGERWGEGPELLVRATTAGEVAR
jgi:SAM-dependent methyltransferase